jgi:hypothetical protein
MALSGASATIQKALGHSSTLMTERYVNLQIDPIRAALQKGQEMMASTESVVASPVEHAMPRRLNPLRLVGSGFVRAV